MLAASADIEKGKGLLENGTGVGDEDQLTAITALVQEMQSGEEGLIDTYARLAAETEILKGFLKNMGVQSELSGVEFVKFADGLVTAAGGIQAATTMFDAFYSNYYSQLERDLGQRDEYIKEMEKQFAAIGMSTDVSLAEFRDAFEAALPNLSEDDIIKWVKAGNVLAEFLKLGDPAVIFMDNIHSQLAQMVGSTYRNYTKALADVETQLENNVQAARLLKLSSRDLADIQRLAAMQTRQLMASLRGDIAGLISQLFPNNSDAAGDAQSAQDDYFNSAIDHTNELSDAERERYQAAQQAIKQIDEFLNQLQTGDLSTNDWSGRLQASGDQFNELLQRAMSGDAEAMTQLTQYAQQYLQQAQSAYGNNSTYAGIEQYVEQMLQQARDYFETIPNPGD